MDSNADTYTLNEDGNDWEEKKMRERERRKRMGEEGRMGGRKKRNERKMV